MENTGEMLIVTMILKEVKRKHIEHGGARSDPVEFPCSIVKRLRAREFDWKLLVT